MCTTDNENVGLSPMIHREHFYSERLFEQGTQLGPTEDNQEQEVYGQWPEERPGEDGPPHGQTSLNQR